MSRKFITQRELNFISNVTKELLQGVVEEEVRYYAISRELSHVNALYEEATNKVWMPPVKINALVLFDQGSTVAGRFSLDSKFSGEVYFHLKELTERNVSVREGDTIEYGGIFYEIVSATQPQLVFGQINNKVMTKCILVPSREGQFVAGGDSARNDDRDRPVAENPTGVPPTNTISTDPTYAPNPLVDGAHQFPAVYYGVATAQGSYTEAFVTAFGVGLRANSISQIGTLQPVTAGATQYVYVILPSSFSAQPGSFVDKETGFEMAVSRVAQVTVHDSTNGATLYDVFRTNRPGLGTVTVEVI